MFTFLCPQQLLSQYLESQEKLVSRSRPGAAWYISSRPSKPGHLRKYDRLMVDITQNNFHGEDLPFFNDQPSLGVNVALMHQKILSKGNTFSLAIGLGYSHFNYKSFKGVKSNLQDGYTNFYNDSINDWNKLKMNYIKIPFEMRFRTKGYKHFKVIMGAEIAYALNTVHVAKRREPEMVSIYKQYTFADSHPWRLGATFRVGFRNVALFGAYYFTPVFTNSESVQIYPFSLGITFSLF